MHSADVWRALGGPVDASLTLEESLGRRANAPVQLRRRWRRARDDRRIAARRHRGVASPRRRTASGAPRCRHRDARVPQRRARAGRRSATGRHLESDQRLLSDRRRPLRPAAHELPAPSRTHARGARRAGRPRRRRRVRSATDGRRVGRQHSPPPARAAHCARTRDEWLAHPQYAAVRALPLLDIARARAEPAGATLDRATAHWTAFECSTSPACLRGRSVRAPLPRTAPTCCACRRRTCPRSRRRCRTRASASGRRSSTCTTPTTPRTCRDLVRDADVFVQSYRPGALDALGFGPAALAALNPRLVYVSLSAYSHVGPWHDRRGYDTLVQTATGMAREEGSAFGDGRAASRSGLAARQRDRISRRRGRDARPRRSSRARRGSSHPLFARPDAGVVRDARSRRRNRVCPARRRRHRRHASRPRFADRADHTCSPARRPVVDSPALGSWSGDSRRGSAAMAVAAFMSIRAEDSGDFDEIDQVVAQAFGSPRRSAARAQHPRFTGVRTGTRNRRDRRRRDRWSRHGQPLRARRSDRNIRDRNALTRVGATGSPGRRHRIRDHSRRHCARRCAAGTVGSAGRKPPATTRASASGPPWNSESRSTFPTGRRREAAMALPLDAYRSELRGNVVYSSAFDDVTPG